MQPTGRLALHWKVLIALILGVLVGAVVNEYWTADTWKQMGVADPKAFVAGKPSDANTPTLTAETAKILKLANTFVGDLFLRGLRFIAIPVVFFSLVVAVAGVGDLRKVGRVGVKAVLWFLFTMTVSVAIALAIALLVRPGSFVSESARDALLASNASEAAVRIKAAQELPTTGAAYFFQYLLDLVPANPFVALAGGPMLQVLSAAILFGIGLTMIAKESADLVVRFCSAAGDAVMALVRLVLLLSPYAVFCLSSRFIADVGPDALLSLLVFCLSVVGGLAAIVFVFQPIMLLAVTPKENKIGLRRFLRGMAPAFTLAFSSSSSSATLPATIQCTRDGLGVPADIANFVCPLGSTLNMDGTALYQVLSVLFLAQLFGVELTMAQHLTVAVMAIAVAVGSPGLPGASVVMMSVVLDAVGVPVAGVAIILAVDRLLDMCRTVANVSGDAVSAVAVASSEGRMGRSTPSVT